MCRVRRPADRCGDELVKIIVSGMVAGEPHHGGATWAVAQYVLGLRRLGHDVLLVEPLTSSPAEEVRNYFDAVCSRFDLTGRAALLVAGYDRDSGAQ
jgi:hypothetical protein